MSHNPAKDFGPIAEDYAFFERQATEAREDARVHAEHLAEVVPAEGTVRMLDFGCGSGTFTTRFLQQTGWAPERLRLTLVEPVESARRQAVSCLAPLTASLDESATLPAGLSGFDVVLSNHVLYYVPDLKGQLAGLIGALSPSGLFVTAIAARTNLLVELWIAGFRLLDRDIPYHLSEDVEAALSELKADYRKRRIPYELTFEDTEENRMRIIRFLLADHLPQMPRQPLVDFFDRYQRSGRIEIQTASDHYAVRSRPIP